MISKGKRLKSGLGPGEAKVAASTPLWLVSPARIRETAP